MTDRQFARKIRRMARIKTWAGEMSKEELVKIKQGCRDPKTVKAWRAKLEHPMYGAPWMKPEMKQGLIDWPTVWEWLKKNWPTILQILLSLLVFLGEKPDEDDNSSDAR